MPDPVGLSVGLGLVGLKIYFMSLKWGSKLSFTKEVQDMSLFLQSIPDLLREAKELGMDEDEIEEIRQALEGPINKARYHMSHHIRGGISIILLRRDKHKIQAHTNPVVVFSSTAKATRAQTKINRIFDVDQAKTSGIENEIGVTYDEPSYSHSEPEGRRRAPRHDSPTKGVSDVRAPKAQEQTPQRARLEASGEVGGCTAKIRMEVERHGSDGNIVPTVEGSATFNIGSASDGATLCSFEGHLAFGSVPRHVGEASPEHPTSSKETQKPSASHHRSGHSKEVPSGGHGKAMRSESAADQGFKIASDLTAGIQGTLSEPVDNDTQSTVNSTAGDGTVSDDTEQDPEQTEYEASDYETAFSTSGNSDDGENDDQDDALDSVSISYTGTDVGDTLTITSMF
ncbi:hypothetical protein CALVIDRAFT_599506 [Calocera viscosa TUFC12733]|uniref:Uncharacterized protein n=1 Tax=Calocera viscosa (strain TUFC12733) TaxID=1330018 RepID=A0A167KVK5_CALVF|nr:hypothetical protein CALVIDRAFT_599506 [Calocera viscosa TUFC12733]